MPLAGTAARRYAEAAFEIATSAGTVDGWQRDLALAAELARNEDVVRAVDSPAAPFERRRALVGRLLESRVSPQVMNLAVLLTERERFGLLPQIKGRFDELVRASRGIVAATVTSAAPLTADELAAIEARIRELSGEAVELTTAVDPSLIGGITVRIGDRLIDSSVRGRLERLREKLIQGTA